MATTIRINGKNVDELHILVDRPGHAYCVKFVGEAGYHVYWLNWERMSDFPVFDDIPSAEAALAERRPFDRNQDWNN